MADPEEVVIHAAQVATIGLRALWRRHAARVRGVELEDVRRRLELYVTALIGDCAPIVAVDVPASSNWLTRWFRIARRRPAEFEPSASSIGARIRLPRHIEPSRGPDTDLGTYRLLALDQMLRILWAGPRNESDATASELSFPFSPISTRRHAVRSGNMVQRPRARPALENEEDLQVGPFVVKGCAQESAEDPLGLRRPIDREPNIDPNGLADSLSELPEARLVRTPDVSREWLLCDDPPPRTVVPRSMHSGARAIVYPEWDFSGASYVMPGAVVYPRLFDLGDERWATEALSRHAGLVRDVRRRFERVRPRRLRRSRQPDGEDMDLGALVTAYADRMAGFPSDDRVYEATRPLRRDLAICVLLDASASTDAWVTRRSRIIDVEKEALLIVSEALAVLGDRSAVLAFSGQGPERVSLHSLKAFEERHGAHVRRRIAALEPNGYTRLGAAMRHATALLAGERARRRLLLVLTDGRPNDVDRYEGRHGVEDSRQAIFEARLEGISPFCLTVDRSAPAYAGRIFGTRAFTVLHAPERLPVALTDLLRRLSVT